MESILNKFEAYLVTKKCAALNSVHAYVADIKQFALFTQTNQQTLMTANQDTIKLFLKELKKKNITSRSIARKISSLKLFYKWAQDQLQWNNIATNFIIPKIEKKLPEFLTPEEVQELLEVAQNDTAENGKRNFVLLYLLYAGGLRISELTSLRIPQISFTEGIVKVHGKGAKERIVPLPHAIMELLKEYLDSVHKKFVAAHQATDYLFPTIYAGKIKPLSRQACWMMLKELCKKTTINRPISPHVLRHSIATHLLKNGAHLRSLQLLLGHENLSTVEIYTHIELSYLRTVYDKKHPRS